MIIYLMHLQNQKKKITVDELFNVNGHKLHVSDVKEVMVLYLHIETVSFIKFFCARKMALSCF